MCPTQHASRNFAAISYLGSALATLHDVVASQASRRNLNFFPSRSTNYFPEGRKEATCATGLAPKSRRDSREFGDWLSYPAKRLHISGLGRDNFRSINQEETLATRCRLLHACDMSCMCICMCVTAMLRIQIRKGHGETLHDAR